MFSQIHQSVSCLGRRTLYMNSKLFLASPVTSVRTFHKGSCNLALDVKLRHRLHTFHSRRITCSRAVRLSVPEDQDRARPTIRERLQNKKDELEDKGDEVKSKVFNNLFDRFFNYLKSYGAVLETAFPDALKKTYQVFSSGSSGCFNILFFL